MNQIIKGLQEYIDGSDFYRDINEELYFEVNPFTSEAYSKSPTYPYCIFQYIGSIPSWNFREEKIEVDMIQFTLVSREHSSSELLSLADELEDLMDFAQFDIEDYYHTYCFRRDRSIAQLETEPRTWQAVYDYEIRMQEI